MTNTCNPRELAAQIASKSLVEEFEPLLNEQLVRLPKTAVEREEILNAVMGSVERMEAAGEIQRARDRVMMHLTALRSEADAYQRGEMIRMLIMMKDEAIMPIIMMLLLTNPLG